MMNRLVLMLLAAACTIMAYGQQDESVIKDKVLESSVGTWRMSNDTVTFEVTLKKCKKSYGEDIVNGICGTYKCVKNVKGEKVVSEGNQLNGSNAYTDYERHANTVSFYFYDEVMKKSTSASVKPVGDTLYWMIYPYIDTHPVTVYGKVISDPQYPKGWSVPIKAVLYRVKEGKE